MEVELFEEICKSVPYRRKGMFYSEVFLFLQACQRHQVETIIESGVKLGMSTALLRAAFSGELISIDKEACQLPIEEVDFMQGDSRKLIPQILRQSAGRRVAVLIDGPKGAEAVKLMWLCLGWANVRLVGVHDLLPSVSGPLAESCHSHDRRFRESFGQLDELIKHDYRLKYPQGPGLAIWEKKQ